MLRRGAIEPRIFSSTLWLAPIVVNLLYYGGKQSKCKARVFLPLVHSFFAFVADCVSCAWTLRAFRCGGRCEPDGRGCHRRWWDRRSARANAKPAVGNAPKELSFATPRQRRHPYARGSLLRAPRFLRRRTREVCYIFAHETYLLNSWGHLVRARDCRPVASQLRLSQT